MPAVRLQLSTSSRRATLGAALTLAACAPQKYEARPLEARRLVDEFVGRRLEDPDLAVLARAAAGDPGELHWDFEGLTRVALVQRPELALASAQIEEARAAVVTAGARPNPTLSIDPEIVPGAADPWILGWILDVPFETGGRRDLRVRAAEEKLSAEQFRLPRAAWSVRVDVRAALNELHAARAEVADGARRRTLEEQRLALQRTRFTAGEIDRRELGRAEQGLAQAEELAADARERESRALSALAEALGLPRVALESARIAQENAVLPAPPEAGDARELALANRLDLRAALAEYAATEAELQLELARQYPDLHLAPGWSWDQGDNKLALGVSLELPLLDHNEGPIAEAEARRTSSAAHFEALQDSELGRLESARVAYADALERERIRRRSEALAEAEERRVEQGLAAGAVDRLTLVEAQLARLARARERAEAGAAALQALLRLEDELQCPLTGDGARETERGSTR
jgi:outer membrane protein TolC